MHAQWSGELLAALMQVRHFTNAELFQCLELPRWRLHICLCVVMQATSSLGSRADSIYSLFRHQESKLFPKR